MKIETLVISSCLGLMLWILFGIVVFASNNKSTTNNYYITEVTEVTQVTDVSNMTITSGISSDDLAKGVATAMAAGGHQFDYSTQSWQGSVNSAFQLSGDNENNVSFGLGKRWDQMDALFHMSYTPNSSDDWVTVGGTFRF